MPDQATGRLYSRTRERGLWGQAWSALTRRPRRLLPLNEIKAACAVHAHRDAGIRTVPISQICGSNGRSDDFDPLQDHSKRRWLRVAALRRRGKVLPPVELVQIEDVYYVQDGHHRISVAQALGQQDIEARVMVWRVTGPLSWETPAAVHSFTGQESETRHHQGSIPCTGYYAGGGNRYGAIPK